jgi:hypothetical protein
MLKTLMILALAFAMATPHCAMARDVPAITKAEARSLPAAVVKRRVMEQLSAILTGDGYTGRKPPVRPLTDLSFRTRPRATAVPGLCQVDWLTISFRLEAGAPLDADTPAMADGVSVTHHFLFRKPPTNEYQEIVDHGRTPDDARCRGADWLKDDFFSAPDVSIATDGYLLAYRAMDAILAGKPAFAFACSKFPDDTRTCAEIVHALRPERLSNIDECEAGAGGSLSASCYLIHAGEYSLRIIADRLAPGPDQLAALTVVRVDLASLLILAHERID